MSDDRIIWVTIEVHTKHARPVSSEFFADQMEDEEYNISPEAFVDRVKLEAEQMIDQLKKDGLVQ